MGRGNRKLRRWSIRNQERKAQLSTAQLAAVGWRLLSLSLSVSSSSYFSCPCPSYYRVLPSLSSHKRFAHYKYPSTMETDRKEKNPWLSVPQFGDWDQKGELPDYSMDFSKIREMRKQNKRDPSRASLGNEEEFINPTAPAIPATNKDNHFDQSHSPTTRRSFLRYFNCCVKS